MRNSHEAPLALGNAVVYVRDMDTPMPPSSADVAGTEDQRRSRLEWEARAIDEAEAEAEREGWIEGDEVLAWMRSWGTLNELPPPEPRK